MSTSEITQRRTIAPTLVILTLARLILNGARRFPYVILTPMSAALGVPRSTLESALALEWAAGAIGPFTGPYIDRLGRKRMMLIGVGSLTAFCALGAISTAWAVIVMVIIALGLSKILFDPAMQAYIADRTPYKWRGMAIGVTELAWSGSLFIFGPLAAFLVARVSVNAIFAVLGVGGAITFVLMAVMLPADAPSQHVASQITLRAGWSILRASRAAMALLLACAMISVSAEAVVIVYEAWFRSTFNLDTLTLGSVAAVISAAEVVGEGFVIVLADRLGKRRLVVGGLITVAIAYFALPLMAGSLPAALVALFLIYLAFEISIVTLIPLATEVLPHARGTMLSTNVTALALGRALGTISGGWMFRAGGLMLNGTVAMLLTLIAAGLIWRFVREHTAQPVSNA